MPQTAKYIEAPYQGVSQAPPQVRPDNQAEDINDTFLSVPQGATKRPPFDWQARLGGHPGHSYGAFEVIERVGPDDAFLTVTNEGGSLIPRLYLTQGIPRGYEPGGYAGQPITISPEAQLYLNTGSPSPATELSIVTVEDYTFILNRKAIVGKLPTRSPARNKEAMVWVRQAVYARQFSVTITPEGSTPVTATVQTPNGTNASDAKWVDTEVIARALYAGGPYTAENEASNSGNLNGVLVEQGWTVTRIGPVIYIQAPAGIDFTVDVTDGQGGTAMVAVKDKVQRFSDLPVKSVAGFTVRIAQQSGSVNDDFFVHYVPTAGAGTGVWEETIAPNAELGLDPATMPVGLFYDGAWKLDVLPWKPRGVGDETLALDPDFVGQALQDLTFWRGRLALISSEAVTLSSAEDPFRFYPDTLSTVVDGDPLSFLSPFPNRSVFRYAVPFEEKLIAFGDTSQAVVSSSGGLTLANARIDVLTTYEFAGSLRPISSNGKIYFAAPHGQTASTVYELKADRVTNVTGGEDMTGAVPRFVPANLDRVANCPVNYLAVYAVSGSRVMYPHLFRYAEDQRVQNAWSRWALPEGWQVGGMLFRNTRMYVLAVAPDKGEAHLALCDLSPDILDDRAGATILTHLNFRLTEGQTLRTYEQGVTTVSVPYPLQAPLAVRATVAAPGGLGGVRLTEAGLQTYPEGYLVEASPMGLRSFTLAGDWTGCPMWFGLAYTARIDLSRFYALGADNRPLRSGRLSIRKVRIDVADTGYLTATVTAGGRVPATYTFTGLYLDDPASQYDKAPRATAVFTFPVMCENEQVKIALENDSHLPHKVLGLEWTGELNLRASR